MTGAVAFDLDVEMDSSADAAELFRLLEAAKKGCFIEQTLSRGLQIGHRLKIGEDWHDA